MPAELCMTEKQIAYINALRTSLRQPLSSKTTDALTAARFAMSEEEQREVDAYLEDYKVYSLLVHGDPT